MLFVVYGFLLNKLLKEQSKDAKMYLIGKEQMGRNKIMNFVIRESEFVIFHKLLCSISSYQLGSRSLDMLSVARLPISFLYGNN